MEHDALVTAADSKSTATKAATKARESVTRAARAPLSSARDALSTVEERAIAELKRTERRAASARAQLGRGVTEARKQADRILPF
jgi:hypothetical protein